MLTRRILALAASLIMAAGIAGTTAGAATPQRHISVLACCGHWG
jgi:uncharacterized membrane protein YtjA (UPF0391 family)